MNATVSLHAVLAARLVVVVSGAFTPAAAQAQSAHFWLSTVSSGTAGPDVVASAPAFDVTETLYLWGRPTDGRQLWGVSLNVVASTDGVDFVDGTYTVNNTIDGSNDRFEFVRDSSTAPDLESEYDSVEVATGDADELLGLGGVTISGPAGVRGIGPVCSAGEMNCETAGDGQPAWLLAELDVRMVTGGKSVDLYLQIGERGIVERELATGDYDLDGEVESDDYLTWADAFGSTTLLAADGNGDGTVDAADYTLWRDHFGDIAVLLTTADTDVRFGTDAGAGVEPLHNALLDRETNLFGDDPDASFTIGAAPSAAVPEPDAGMLALLASVPLAVRTRGLRG